MRQRLVVPQRENRGITALSVVVAASLALPGIALSVLFELWAHRAQSAASTPEWKILVPGFAMLLVIAVAAPWTFGWMLALRSASWWRVLGACLIFGLVYDVLHSVGTKSVGRLHYLPSSSYFPPAPPALLLEVLQAFAGAALLGFTAFAGYAIWRGVVAIIDSDGMTCWACGYSAGSPTITKCPECGKSLDAALRRWAWVHAVAEWAGRHKRRIGQVVVVLAAILAVRVTM